MIDKKRGRKNDRALFFRLHRIKGGEVIAVAIRKEPECLDR